MELAMIKPEVSMSNSASKKMNIAFVGCGDNK